jgi:hypothetical protein
MKKISAVFLLLTLCIGAFAQQKKIDSIKRLIATAKDDTSRVMTMNSLARVYFISKPDSALSITQEMLRISTSAQFVKGQAMALNDQGIVYRNLGNNPKSLNYFL